MVWYLVLAFGGAWIPWGVVGLLGGTLDDPVLQLLTAGFVPALAAVVVRVWITKEGLRGSGLALNLRASWRLYLAACLLPEVVLVTALLVAWVCGLWHPGAVADPAVWTTVLAGPVICVVMSPIFWGEEYGWTAYLRDRVLPGRPVATTFLTGVIWGVWHFPLPWVGYFGPEATTTDKVVAMLLWLPLSVLLEMIIGWLWTRSRSVWTGTMLHTGSNLVAAAGIDGFLGTSVSLTTATLLLCAGLVPIVLVLVLAERFGPSPHVVTGPGTDAASHDDEGRPQMRESSAREQG